MSKVLIPFKITPAEVFVKNGLSPIIEAIKKEVESHEPDVSTAKGRKAIASLAAKVSKSKTFVDKLGKELKAEYKLKIDPIDAERKRFRDELDILRDKARKPLTDYEEEQKRIEEQKRFEEEYNKAWEEAIAENIIFDREREIARKEAEFERKEEERKAIEEAERLENERIEHEARIKKEAEELARREVEEKAERERQEIIRKQIEAEQAAQRAVQEKKEAEERAKREVEEAKIKAEHEKQAALEAQRKNQEEKERRIQEEKRLKEERERIIAANKEHQKNINNAIIQALSELDINRDTAKEIIIAILKDKIPCVTINY